MTDTPPAFDPTAVPDWLADEPPTAWGWVDRRILLSSLGFGASGTWYPDQSRMFVWTFEVDQAQFDTALVAAVTDTTEANRTTITDRLAADLAVIDEITAFASVPFTQAGVRDVQRQVKDLARMNKRLIRYILNRLEATD